MEQTQAQSQESSPTVGRPRPTNVNVIFSLTVLPHEQALLRRGRRLVGCESDARDLVQETLERALRTFHAFRPGTAVWAWLRTIMNSVWIDGWRRRQAAAKICMLPEIDMAAPDPEPEPHDGADEEILRLLPQAIAQLPPIFRRVLELRVHENCSYGTIAERLGIPSRTVGTRILRARKQLRAILEQEMSGTQRTPPGRTRRGSSPARARARAGADMAPAAAHLSPEEIAPLTPATPSPKAAWQRAGV